MNGSQPCQKKKQIPSSTFPFFSFLFLLPCLHPLSSSLTTVPLSFTFVTQTSRFDIPHVVRNVHSPSLGSFTQSWFIHHLVTSLSTLKLTHTVPATYSLVKISITTQQEQKQKINNARKTLVSTPQWYVLPNKSSGSMCVSLYEGRKT